MNKYSYIKLFCAVFLIKLVVFVITISNGIRLFGGESDGDYYHQYAIGLVDYAYNIWPIILRELHELSLYSRTAIISIIFLLASLVVPILVAELAIHEVDKRDTADYWRVVLLVSLYPSLYFQTLDIYRDVFMMVCFLLFLVCCRKLSDKFSLFVFILAVLLSYFLYQLREYLGAACLLALLIWPFYSFRKYSFSFFIVVYLLLLTLLFHFGFLDSIVYQYRSIFDSMQGGSNLGIRFTDTVSFLPLFLQSFAGQLLGFFFPNKASILVFMAESLLFMYALVYVIRNKQYANAFVSFLFLFFVIYMSVWLLGNDNLGSATRLRMFNYITVLIMYFTIKRNKELALKGHS